MGLREVNLVRRRAIGILSACFILLLLQADVVLQHFQVVRVPLTDYYMSLNIIGTPDRTYLLYMRNPEFGSAAAGFIHSSINGGKWSNSKDLSFNPGAAQVIGSALYAVRKRDFSVFNLEELLEGDEKAWKSSGAYEFEWPVILTVAAENNIWLIGIEKTKDEKHQLRTAMLAEGETRELIQSIGIAKPKRTAACLKKEVLYFFYSLPGQDKVRLACRNPDGDWEENGELHLELSSFACACIHDTVHIVGAPGGDKPVDSSALVHYMLAGDNTILKKIEFHHDIATFLGQHRRVSEVALIAREDKLLLAARLGSVIATAGFNGTAWTNFTTLNKMPVATRIIMWSWFGCVLALSLALVVTGFQLYRAKRGRLRLKPISESTPIEAASILRRLAAFSIDFAVIYLIAVTLVQPTSLFTGGRSLLDAINLHHPLAIAGIFLLYFSLPEAIFGQTPGKALLGVVVKDMEGGRVGIWAAFLRNMFKLNDILLVVEACVLLSTQGRRRLGDFAAGTTVAKKIKQGE